MMNSKKVLGQTLAAVVLAGGLTALTSTTAEAAGGNCGSIRQEKEDTGYNSYRVRARCASLQANSKAKGVLDKAGASDPETQWFTRLNTYYYSNYTTCGPTVPCDNTRVKIEPV